MAFSAATMLWVVGTLVAAALLYAGFVVGQTFLKNFHRRRVLEAAGFVPPRTEGYTLWKGHMDLFARSNMHFTAVTQLMAQDPAVPETFPLYLGFFYTMLVSYDPDVVHQVLLKKNYPKTDYDSVRPIVGNGLLTSEGDVWSRKRRVMNHGFKPDFLRQMVPAFSSYGTLFADAISRQVAAHPGEPVDMGEWFSKVTLDIIGEVGFGYRFGFTTSSPDDERTTSIKNMVYVSLAEPAKLLTNPMRYITHPRETYNFYQELGKFKMLGLDIVREARLREQSGDEKGGNSILDLLMKMGSANAEDRMSDEDFLDEIMTFLVAGHETTASTSAFTLLLLNKHSEALAKVVAEIDSILPTPTSPCGYEEQAKMEYLGAVFKEVLRMHPIAPGAMRTVPAGETIDGKVLTGDTPIYIPYTALHKSKRFWGDDAEEFKPERWLGESPVKHLFAYIPFSNGPRICIGKDFALLEYRVLMASFLRRFRFRIATDLAYRDDVRPDDPDFAAEMTDRATKPVGAEVAFAEPATQRPRDCTAFVEEREK
ncbi:cytochrome P450 [Hyaloraphidium curvatum]|nr:cytochrome P450 [Hyaloraphidium curvatum]